ncbi:MAG: diguanylate cyclase [Pseudomonadota bacterium]|nr:diguanylate cyclase [Pseudomonadota bacterium]
MAFISNLADHDELSKALNRRAFMRELALLFVSIENLKDINDRHGHAVGDAMVEHSADVML